MSRDACRDAKRIEPLTPQGRMRALAHENRRLHEVLTFIAEYGDAHNAEVTRMRREGEPESWAARTAYFAIHPERQT